MSGRPLALVTGAARRVGRAIALALARGGFDLVITYNRSEEEARAAEGELRGLGAAVRVERVDLDDLAAAEGWAARMARELPRLDVLVHNASVYGPTPVGALGAEEVLRHFRVNAAAPVLLTARLAPLLAKSDRAGGGSVVAMCDIHAMGRPRRRFAAYAMSKAALAEMVRTLARDLAPRVRVNGVAPGVVMWSELAEEDEEMRRKYLSRVPLGRAGTAEEAAEVVRWLAVDAVYVTGEILRIDGGRWLA